ncbi:MAG: hypothetical protein K9L28_06715 [Synergistales bacterium]|nr:hypothetical protein [Synergistales bacterium]
MFNRLFGEYLLRERIVPLADLREALAEAERSHIEIGALAVCEGLLDEGKLDEIGRVQKQQDARFGEIAVSLGYLTEEQLSLLLERQKNHAERLSTVLLRRGVLDAGRMEEARRAYEEEGQLSPGGGIAYGLSSTISLAPLAEEFGEGFAYERYLEYFYLFNRCVTRFVDRQAIPVDLGEEPLPEEHGLVRQRLYNDAGISVSTLLSARPPVLLEIASRFAEEEIPGFDELAESSILEFLNLVNGLYTVNQSSTGRDLSMDPPSLNLEGGESVSADAMLGTMGFSIASGLFRISLLSETAED